uniref:ABC3 transporter permease C-terminal domain-containing protein n=1 Tax=Chromera velia CCMP2878 TaxID=1169474 RepID=A0A0G4HS92_9ALVE|eukprot:Cvel_1302.t1-p1 / transcript=Cvel_1302.t1 / gene=Cvel_1302 / organism=Chromera_velia_CCMP2878 / gene_product=hypothetical protein / transcript_product=hypothetical protein / location=Cvel_scaffold44:50423-61999(-) / protein_length=1351 / sequence_SO=supercontig / SO=protein_coding / is_pseudo=false
MKDAVKIQEGPERGAPVSPSSHERGGARGERKGSGFSWRRRSSEKGMYVSEAKTANFWGGLRLTFSYASAQVSRNPQAFRIGVFTVFLVVFFGVVLQNAVQTSPIIFLRVAEDDIGEADLLYLPQLSSAYPIAPTSNFSQKDEYDFRAGFYPASLALSSSIPDDSSTGASSFSIDTFETSTLSALLNETFFAERTADSPDIKATFPRWIFRGTATNPDDESKSATTLVLIADTEKERKYRYGRKFTERPLSDQECYVSGTIVRALEVPPDRGRDLKITLNLASSLEALGIDSTFPSTADSSAILTALGFDTSGEIPLDTGGVLSTLIPSDANFTLDINGAQTDVSGSELATLATNSTVSGSDLTAAFDASLASFFQWNYTYVNLAATDNPQGKWTKALGNTVLIDSRYYLRRTAEAVEDSANAARTNVTETDPALGALIPAFDLSPITTDLNNADPDDFALMVLVLVRGRTAIYFAAPKAMTQQILRKTDAVARDIGWTTSFSLQTPIQTALETTQFVRLFLDSIFGAVVFVLTLLSIVLVYSLMLNDVEEKTYEFGMLRALGMPKYTLVKLLLIQALLFAIPGLILGLLCAWLVSLFVTYFLASFAATEFSYELHRSAAVLGLGLGLFMPIAANIVPISRALSKTLRDALDIYHVLMGLLLGLVLLAQVAQPFLQQALLWVLMPWKTPDSNLRPLVGKSLEGHRERNRKTALMFTIALAFLIFAGAMFVLQGNALVANVKLFMGADVVVTASRWTRPLPEATLKAYFEKEEAKTRPYSRFADSSEVDEMRIVAGHSFETFELGEAPGTTTSVSNGGQVPDISASMIGIQDNFASVTYAKFIMPSETQDEVIEEARGGQPEIESLFWQDPVEDDREPGENQIIRIQINNQEETLLRYDPNGVLTGVPAVNTDASMSATVLKRDFGKTDFVDVTDRPVSVIAPEGVRDRLAVNAGSSLLISLGIRSAGAFILPAVARGLVRKLPGIVMSSYQLLTGTPNLVTSEAQIQSLWRLALRGQRLYYSSLAGINRNSTDTELPLGAGIPGYERSQAYLDLYGSQADENRMDTETRERQIATSAEAEEEAGDNSNDNNNGNFASTTTLTSMPMSSTLLVDDTGDTQGGLYTSAEWESLSDSDTSTTNLDLDTALSTSLNSTYDRDTAEVPLEDIGKKKLYVSLVSKVTQEDRDRITNAMRNIYYLMQLCCLLNSSPLYFSHTQYVFLVVGAIALLLAFFLLTISFQSNVRENAWEFGVIRALGLSRSQCVRLYSYEALALTSASTILGAAIGICVAITLTLQFNLFTELPFEFAFPLPMFLVMLLLSVLTAIWGSYLPTMKMASVPISFLVRGMSDSS